MSRKLRNSFVVALVFAASFAAHAQERRSGGGGLPPYDPAKETRISGVVTGTDTVEMPNGPVLFVLDLKVEGQPLHVMLAPVGWMKEKGIAFTTGVTVEATGVSNGLHYKGDAAMIARQVKAGGKTIAFRDAQGTPEWQK